MSGMSSSWADIQAYEIQEELILLVIWEKVWIPTKDKCCLMASGNWYAWPQPNHASTLIFSFSPDPMLQEKPFLMMWMDLVMARQIMDDPGVYEVGHLIYSRVFWGAIYLK